MVERKRVVVIKAGCRGEEAHLFCEGGVFKLDKDAFQLELCRQDVLCVKQPLRRTCYHAYVFCGVHPQLLIGWAEYNRASYSCFDVVYHFTTPGAICCEQIFSFEKFPRCNLCSNLNQKVLCCRRH